MYFVDIHTHNVNLKTNVISIISIDSKDLSLEKFQNQISNDKLKYSIGIHPWSIKEIEVLREMEKIKEIIKNENVVAVGECGLDRYYAKNEKEVNEQINALQLQIELANHYAKPMIIHCVKAYSDFLKFFNNKSIQVPVIFHAFNGNMDTFSKLLKFNCCFSFGKNIFHSKKMIEILKIIPLNKLFIETDDSEKSIDEIYNYVSTILEMDVVELKRLIYNNYEYYFKQ